MAVPEILLPKSDYVFSEIFGDPADVVDVARFLRALLPDMPPEEFAQIFIADAKLRKNDPLDKYGILDVKLYTASGMVVDVEIQLLNRGYLPERCVYYISKLITEQLSEGEGYGKLHKVICILITNFILIKGSNEYHKRFYLMDDSEYLKFTDKVEMHTFELPKLPKEDDGTVKWRWGRFLTAETKEELDMLKERYEELKHPVAKLLHLSADEEARREYERREKIIRDHESGLYFARNEGIAEGKAKGKAEGIAKGKAEGIAEGKAEGKAEIARAMLHDGMQVSLIARFTGLAPEEIELLKTH